nr:hypothetical protein [Tanacetum cinerariifolium]
MLETLSDPVYQDAIKARQTLSCVDNSSKSNDDMARKYTHSNTMELRYMIQIVMTYLIHNQVTWPISQVLDQMFSLRPTKVEVPKELPKVSMVNTNLKKLKHHLAGFDVVVKERITATAITEGTLKKYQEKDKIRLKPDKNGKHGEAEKSQKQLQQREEEKLNKTQKEGPKMHTQSKVIQSLKKEEKEKD